MFNVQVDDKVIQDMLNKAINERVEELAKLNYFLTYKQLAEYLNISKPTIESTLIETGLLKYYKVGSKYLFKREEVDQVLDDLTAEMDARQNDFLKLIHNTRKGDPKDDMC